MLQHRTVYIVIYIYLVWNKGTLCVTLKGYHSWSLGGIIGEVSFYYDNWHIQGRRKMRPHCLTIFYWSKIKEYYNTRQRLYVCCTIISRTKGPLWRFISCACVREFIRDVASIKAYHNKIKCVFIVKLIDNRKIDILVIFIM